MSIQDCDAPTCTAEEGSRVVEQIVTGRSKDLGDFQVRRLLPAAKRRRVGPFVFVDHIGPAQFGPGRGIDVRPHPHIGLATVTFLFDGAIRHRDSLGSEQDITPGAVNWMTAGRGIVHSERTPPEHRSGGARLHGMQVWLALPRALEEAEPSFVHHAESSIPRVEQPGASLHVIAGTVFGVESPVETASPTFFLAGTLAAGSELAVPDEYAERAVYVADGALRLGEHRIETGALAVLRASAPSVIRAESPSRVALLGGAPLDGDRHLWWNFVSSSKERIERARNDWWEGRFPAVPGDTEFIPLPEDGSAPRPHIVRDS